MFTIMVNMKFASNAAGVLGGLLRDLGQVNGAVGALQKRFKELAPLAVSALSVFAGVKIEKSIWGIVKASEGYTRQLELMKELGPEVVARMPEIKASIISATMQAPTGSAETMTQLLREMIPQLSAHGLDFGITQAEKLLPYAEKYTYVMEPFSKGGREQLLTAIKTSQNRGGETSRDPTTGKMAFDLPKFIREMEAMSAAIRLEGGAVNFGQLQTAMQTAGEALRAMDPRIAYPMLAEEIVSMGTKAGFAHQGLVSQFVGGVMPLRVADALTEEHILKRSEWTSMRGGRVKLNKSASSRFLDVLNDPRAFADKMLAQFDQEHKSLGELIQFLTRIFGRQNVQRLVSDWQSNKPTFDRMQEMMKNVPGTEKTYAGMEARDLKTNIDEIAASWKTFKEVLGAEDTGIALSIMKRLRLGIQELTKEIALHPQIASALLTFVGALGALMVVGGALGVMSFAMAPLGGLATLGTAAAIMAFGAAIYYVLKLVNWHDVHTWALGVRTGISHMLDAIGAGIKHLGLAFVDLATRLRGWIANLVDALRTSIFGAGGGQGAPGSPNWFNEKMRAPGSTAPSSGAPPRVNLSPPSGGSSLHVPMPQSGGWFNKSLPVPGMQHSAYHPGQQSQPIYNVIYLNTDKVAEGVTRSQSRMANRPPAGTTRYDIRSGPLYPSNMIPT